MLQKTWDRFCDCTDLVNRHAFEILHICGQFFPQIIQTIVPIHGELLWVVTFCLFHAIGLLQCGIEPHAISLLQHGLDLHTFHLLQCRPDLNASRLLQCGLDLCAISLSESFDLTGQLQHITPRTKLVLKLHPNMIVNPMLCAVWTQ